MLSFKKKSQIIMEFMLLTSMLLVMAILIIESINQNRSLYETREYILIKDTAAKIQGEISLASSVEDGYSREFELPKNISNKNYNMSLKNNTLIVWINSTNPQYITIIAVPVLNITGYLKKDINTITRSNSIIRIN